MRMLLRVNVPVEAGNSAIKDGSLAKTMTSVLEELKPEASYFLTENGKRTCLIVFDLKSPSDIPSIAERFFIAFNADVQFTPVMDAADLAAGLQKVSAGV
jgi:hypothetical protein